MQSAVGCVPPSHAMAVAMAQTRRALRTPLDDRSGGGVLKGGQSGAGRLPSCHEQYSCGSVPATNASEKTLGQPGVASRPVVGSMSRKMMFEAGTWNRDGFTP